MRIQRLRQPLVHVDVVAAHQVDALTQFDDLLDGALVGHMVGDLRRRDLSGLQSDAVAVALNREVRTDIATTFIRLVYHM